ncbi:hypothetical protein [Bosea sp. MMO-172]|uniref:hypothetical protein n=1 Tax=Bosea sp. MMO-172 TaxID=3127885 RepID=UPI00301AB913
MMALNPAVRQMVAEAAAKYPADDAGLLAAEPTAAHIGEYLSECGGLHNATKGQLLLMMRAALNAETAE